MELGVYSVRDKVAGAFLPPFFLGNDALAVRAFAQACRDGEHQFSKNLQDYSLYKMASFDDASGAFSLLPEPAFLMSGERTIPPEGVKNG